MSTFDDDGNVFDDTGDGEVVGPFGETLFVTDPAADGSQGFGSAVRRFLQAGIYNGDASYPPGNPSSEISDQNPLPYWSFVQLSGLAFHLTWVPDASAGSGGHLLVSADPGAASDEAYLEQIIPVIETRDRAFGFMPQAFIGNAAGDANFTITVKTQFLKSDGTTTGAEVVAGSGLFGNFVTPAAYFRGEFQVGASDAAFLRIRYHFARATGLTSAIASLELYEFRVQLATAPTGYVDQTDPTTYGSAELQATNGSFKIGWDSEGQNYAALYHSASAKGALFAVSVPFAPGDTPTTNTGTGALTAVAVSEFSLRWNGASAATIHGIAGGTESRIIFIANVTAAQTLTLAHQSATEGTAGNRLILPSGANQNLLPGESAFLAYDASTLRWRVLGVNTSVPAFAAPTIALGSAAAAGVAATVIRSDATILAFDSTAPVTQAIGDAAAVGAAAVAARRDHKHGMPAFASPAVVLGSAAAAGAAATVIRSDATIAAFDSTAPVTQAFGDAAAVGAAAFAARRDHKHGMPADPTNPLISRGANITYVISANQNDWAPAGIATASYVFVNQSAGSFTITGISATGFVEGQLLVLMPGGGAGNTLTLAHASASSLSGNRFSCPTGVNFGVRNQGAVMIMYSPSRNAANPFQLIAA